jgi:choline dehydrogenase-like flavoprotein
MHDKVDVLIIGSGASGAAVAWSLADTRMRILCLEQGDWVKPTDYPSNGRDWEARLFSDFAINPNRRARPTDYPINDSNSPIKVVNFNGVGGSTIMYTAHFPRLHPPTSGCARSMALPTTGRSTMRRWSRSSPRTIA